MKIIYNQIEMYFEKFTILISAILGNSITFILAFLLVLFWLNNRHFNLHEINENIHDVIVGASFLTLFVIQKAFNHFTASLHIKINELVASHKYAKNEIMNVELRTEEEIIELNKGYSELAENAKVVVDENRV